MSRTSLEEHVWSSLSVRKHALGRRVCDRLTRRAIRAWDRDVPRIARIEDQLRFEARQDMQLGVIASWLLAAVITEIVKALLAWFRSSHANLCLMYGYQRELHDDDC
jgi:hypothetical protein